MNKAGIPLLKQIILYGHLIWPTAIL